MRRHRTAIACLFVLASAPAAAQEAETVNKSLVRVIAFKDGKPVMTATGFAIGGKGFVVTADHVVTAGEPRVLREGEAADLAKARPAKIVFTNKERNLAIIEVPGLGAPGLRLAAAPVKQGTRVYLFGYPGADAVNSTLTSGLVQKVAVQKIGDVNVTFVQHEASGGPGTGGGPLVNACGGVVGAHGFLLQGGAGLAVGAAEVASVARAHKVDVATAPACTR